jgi:hypothetical protein
MSGPGHHVVQRYHLAHFAGDQPKGQVWIYDKTTGRARSDIPENISVENHFYSIENGDGTWDTRLDDWITNVEGEATSVYDRLLSGDIPAYSQAKYDFSVYLALTYIRTRTQRRMAIDVAGKMLQNVMATLAQNNEWFDSSMSSFEEERGQQMTPERRQEMRELMLNPGGKLKMSVSKDMAFMAWGAIDKLSPLFLHMHWTVLTPQNGFFITSDNPLLQFNPGPRHPVYGDGGFMNKAVEVSFPLSPRRLLLLTHKKRSKDMCQIPRHTVEGQNEARAAQCERELYAHIQSKKIAKLAEEHKYHRLRMTISGGGPKKYAEITSPRRFRKK